MSRPFGQTHRTRGLTAYRPGVDACQRLLLPQVAAEQAWDVETFLIHTCLKATLPPDAWRKGARVLMFEADVFGEKPERYPEIT